MDDLTSEQISEWEAYDRIDPIGTWREDFRMAYLAATITNLAISVHGKKGTKHFPVTEFMPNWSGEEPEKIQTIEEMKAVMQEIATVFKTKKGNQPNPKRIPSKLKSDG